MPRVIEGHFTDGSGDYALIVSRFNAFITEKLLEGALDRGWWGVAALVVFASLLAVIYTGKVIEAAYFREPGEGTLQANAKEVSAGLLAPMFIFAIAIVYFGVDAELIA